VRNGWQTKKLGEICEIERGGSPRPIQNFITTDPKGINWIKIGDATASGKYIYKTEEKIKPEGVKRSRMVYDGDFILSNSMSFGRPYIMKTTGCIHDGWLVLHQPKVDPDYLYHVLSSDLVFSQFDRLAAGSTVRNLNIGLAKSVEIPYPPFPEQKRIVGILDEAFDGIATAKDNAKKNLQNAHALFESHLQSIFTRRGAGWLEKPLISLCSLFVDSAHRTPEYQEEGIPALRPRDVVNGTIALKGAARVSKQEYEIQSRRHRPAPGDIVYSRELSYGWAAALPESPRVCLSQGMCLFRCAPNVESAFLVYVLNGPVGREQALRAAVGAAHPHINLGDIKAYLIPLPLPNDQRRIVRQLDAMAAAIERLKGIYQRKLDTLEGLKKSLLHQAFTGAL
jgi:type I restriction enzyme S subunit